MIEEEKIFWEMYHNRQIKSPIYIITGIISCAMIFFIAYGVIRLFS